MTKTVKLSSFRVDLKRESAGDWQKVPDAPDVAFKVSSLHVPEFRTARAELLQRLQTRYRGDVIPPSVEDAEMGKLYARHILHDWSGLDEPFSRDRAEELLTDPEYRELTNRVVMAAIEMGRIQVQYVEDAKGN